MPSLFIARREVSIRLIEVDAYCSQVVSNQAREGPAWYRLEVGFLVIWYGRAPYPRFTRGWGHHDFLGCDSAWKWPGVMMAPPVRTIRPRVRRGQHGGVGLDAEPAPGDLMAEERVRPGQRCLCNIHATFTLWLCRTAAGSIQARGPERAARNAPAA